MARMAALLRSRNRFVALVACLVAGSLDHRLNVSHHPKGYAVENVSAGYASADAAIGGWQRSPGHNVNLLDKRMRRMGIAAADAPGTRFKTYWALMMTD